MKPKTVFSNTQDLNLDDILSATTSTSSGQTAENTTSSIQIPVDVYEDRDNFYIVAIVSGYKPENVKVDITSENLKIEFAVIKPKIEGEALAEEIDWGTFTRSIIFPSEIDVERSFAQMESSGVLKVILPKFVRTERKTLKINSL